MRIDQYLWCLRYFKSRTLASTACKKGQVRIHPGRKTLPRGNPNRQSGSEDQANQF